MSAYDVVCVGRPFLDLTFLGLERLPEPGEELFAQGLALTPGGAAITAVGAARLGLRTALLWPRGTDLVGEYLRAALERERVDWLGPERPRTAVTAIFPLAGDRAMATFQPADEPDDAALAAVDARAVVVGLDRAGAAPAGAARVYAVGGFPEAERHDAATLRLPGCRALLVNESEALRLTGAAAAEAAGVRLAATGAEAVVVTLGERGALELADGEVVTTPAPAVDAVDTTGAGDLFAAAYVFADLAGAPRAERLTYAGLYAGLSTRTATGVGGAPSLRELEEEARARGLPAVHRPVAMEEKR